MKEQMQVFENFDSDRLNPQKWELLETAAGQGKTRIVQEPGAKTTLSGGAFEIRVECFQNSGNIPSLEHPKHLYVSKKYFPLSTNGITTFSVEMAAENINGNPDDYRDGVAAFVVQDMETAMIFDSIANGKHSYVIYERLQIPGLTSREQTFTYVVDSPLIRMDDNQPRKYHEYSISLDTLEKSARWYVDKNLVFKACDLPAIPKSVRLGFGLFTLHPIIDGKSCSLRGQGMLGRWRNFRYSI